MTPEPKVETKVGDIAGRLRGIKQLYQTSGWAWVLEEGARLLLDLQRERDSLAAKLAVAREALGWYADEKNTSFETGTSRVTYLDGGSKARAALADIDGDGTEGKGG